MAQSKSLGADFWPAANSSSILDSVWARILPSATNELNRNFRSEPWATGSFERGRRLLRGSYFHNGIELDIPEFSIWDVKDNSESLQATLQSFDWLDDLAALRSFDAVAVAKRWTVDWLERYGSGRGAGWSPLIAGRRATRLVEHWKILANGGREPRLSLPGAINRHARFLRRRVRSEPLGWQRIEVLTRLIRLELAIGGYSDSVSREANLLADVCSRVVSSDGEIRSRNPEELLRIGILLTWVSGELSSEGVLPSSSIQEAIARIAVVLRSLRHKSGALPRFHGGGTANYGRLDSFLSLSGNRSIAKRKLSLGYARLVGGSVSVIVDAAAPPSGWESVRGHASTLAFEMHSGGYPLVVNRGSAERIASERNYSWRETAFHSTVEVDGGSSSRFASPLTLRRADDDILVLVPKNVSVEQLPGKDGQTFIARHDGYRPIHGLTHMRRMDLDGLGRRLWGEDTIWPTTEEDRGIFNEAARKGLSPGFNCVARFHLHFDVEAEITRDRSEVGLVVANGEEWRFRFSGDATIDLQESVYFDELSCTAKKSKQIVLDSFVSGAASQVSWSFDKIANADKSFRQGGYR
ncbi:MAG: heparinase II/III family protein [Albidovulum sp.]|nr:heparinase II/III family protein [Albidovulum sp.]MDE0306197.1 heparinase II/III family protein [Albidovulum sp.]